MTEATGSGKRIGGALLIVLGILLLVGGIAVLTLSGGSASVVMVPMVMVALGGILLFGGSRLVRKGEQSYRNAASSVVAPTPTKSAQTAGAVVGLLVFAGLVWYYFGGGLEMDASRRMQDIENKVAADAVTQYGIAKRNGNAMDACVQAGMVAAAYLQAKDEGHYQQWKQTERGDCASAGIQR